MKLKTRIFFITILVLIISCVLLFIWFDFSNSHMITSIKKLYVPVNSDAKYYPLQQIDKHSSMNNLRLFIGLAVVIITGGFLSYFLSSIQMKPIKNLANNLQFVDINNLQKIPLPKVKDENYELINAYNSLIERIEKDYEREKRISANIAHELKTPLTVLKTRYDILEINPNKDLKDYEEAVEISKEKVEYISNVIQRLLNLYRSTNKVNNTLNNTKSIFDKIISDINPLLKDSIKFEYNIVYKDILVDEVLFYQAILNVLQNAVKYTTSGSVKLEVKSLKSTLFILISDTGIGISDEDKKCIFEPFYCVDKSRNKEYGGVGLGLSFTKEVIDLYNGKIYVYDNNPNGTIFKLVFPNIVKD